MSVVSAGEERWDFVVIGSGVAGLRAAIELASSGNVAILTKDSPEDSSSEQAQGGIAVALSDEDRIGLHHDDTIAAGAGLCHDLAVRTMVREGPAYILELIDWGAAFDRKAGGGGRGHGLSFTREAAHSTRRVLHSQGDSTGREMVRALAAKARKFSNIRLFQQLFTVDLIVRDGRCIGVWVMDSASGEIRPMLGRGVMLATGGCGRIYKATSNPPFATGDGVAIAARAGARIQDMEFVQFHPTTLNLPGAPNFLLTEAIRGEGGVLRNRDGERFMERYHPSAELAPRDVVARSIMAEVRRQQDERIVLDLSGLDAEFVEKRFPMIHRTLETYGMDLACDPVPILPAAHYCMGGVRTDRWARTSLPGLFAAGEVACTGVHGANRLASNSLLEGLVFGGRCGEAMIEADAEMPDAAPPIPDLAPCPRNADWIEQKRVVLTDLMWRRVGIERCGSTLSDALTTLRELRVATDAICSSRDWLQLRNMALTGELIAAFALIREESRGAHFRTDFPNTDDKDWRRHLVYTLEELGSAV